MNRERGRGVGSVCVACAVRLSVPSAFRRDPVFESIPCHVMQIKAKKCKDTPESEMSLTTAAFRDCRGLGGVSPGVGSVCV